ncbi:hypothetical protein ACVIW2_003366 [Bradyrhizobium huanghuaihaiense]
MRLGKGLLDAMWPNLAFQLDEIDHGSERAVLVSRQQRKRGGDVIGHHHEPVARVDGEMDGILSFRALAVDHRELAARRIDRHRRNVAEIAMYCVEEATRPIEGEERRIDEVTQQLDVLPGARCIVHRIDVEPVAAGVAFLRGARPDIDE